MLLMSNQYDVKNCEFKQKYNFINCWLLHSVVILVEDKESREEPVEPHSHLRDNYQNGWKLVNNSIYYDKSSYIQN